MNFAKTSMQMEGGNLVSFKYDNAVPREPRSIIVEYT